MGVHEGAAFFLFIYILCRVIPPPISLAVSNLNPETSISTSNLLVEVAGVGFEWSGRGCVGGGGSSPEIQAESSRQISGIWRLLVA